MRIIPNQSEKHFVSRLMKNGQKSIRLNPINSETWIWTNPKPSFQSTWIRTRIDPSRISNQNQCLGINRIKSDWFWPFFIKRYTKCFSDWFGMLRIDSDTDIGMNRNSSDWPGMNFNPILSPGSLSSITSIPKLEQNVCQNPLIIFFFVNKTKNILRRSSWDKVEKNKLQIHSESIRTISIHSDICIQDNANHSKPIRKTFRISFDEKRSKINLT